MLQSTKDDMKTRAKWFLGALLTALIMGSATADNGKSLAPLLVMLFLLWAVWRAFVFLTLLLKPVREKMKPLVVPLNAHMHDTMRRSGLGKVADMSEKFSAGVDGAVAQTQKGIDERNKI